MINEILGPIFTKLPENNRLERIWKIAQVDFKKRYYNDVLGLVWALANPLMQIIIYYFVFTRIYQNNQENFVLFLFCGIIIWISFSEATTFGMHILQTKKYLTENIQFNWLDLYSSHIISIGMGLLFNIVAYLLLLLLLGASLGEYFYIFPIILLTWFLLSYGASIILGLLRTVFEDIIHIWNIVLMIGFWVSGIVFSGTFYFENYTWFTHVNPFVGLILNTRACLLENNEISFSLLIENLVFGLVVYALARILFKKYAKRAIEKL